MEPPVNTQPRFEHLQPNVLVIILRILGVIFLLDTAMALVIVGYFALNNVQQWQKAYVGILLLAHAAKYILITITVVKLFTDWAGRSYYLSGHQLIERLGLVNMTETAYELSQVKSVIVQQTWLGSRFNYGTIMLSYAGGGRDKEILLRDINNPRSYKDYFDQHLQVPGWIQ